jgi:hypothetical protein
MRVFILQYHQIITSCWYIFRSILLIHDQFYHINFKLSSIILQELNNFFGIIFVYHHKLSSIWPNTVEDSKYF